MSLTVLVLSVGLIATDQALESLQPRGRICNCVGLLNESQRADLEKTAARP